tara:strand:+ start:125 stop:523 length:399 start_codon:yes stop_codon:yes gene_type:complete
VCHSAIAVTIAHETGAVMSVYLIAQINIHNRERYAQYEAGFMEIFAQYGGEMLAVDEAPTVLEGQWPHTRTVLIRFADKVSADAWYKSDAYQQLARHRWEASVADVAILQGVSAPLGEQARMKYLPDETRNK